MPIGTGRPLKASLNIASNFRSLRFRRNDALIKFSDPHMVWGLLRLVEMHVGGACRLGCFGLQMVYASDFETISPRSNFGLLLLNCQLPI